MTKGRWVRESDSRSVLDKRFRPARKRKIASDISMAGALPEIVILDLRKGNLRSLESYLETHHGIPHEGVAGELRLLLSGRPEQTKYRLIAIEHPEGPAARPGPMAKQGVRAPTSDELNLVRAFERALRIERGKKGLAEENAAGVTGRSIKTIQRARRVVKEYDQAQAEEWIITPKEIERCMAELQALSERR